ncbi:hypothetical protein CALVIDRAFT_568364 [Calocera viscosa TUFC12733]|uniref:Uncharacterized protein n=1 Tax=Calocera viscosa (strain TUFC12733) TaxID=1330018 RepID=A0A167H7X5_CALVF|nr:hypothetical protein CALVIDRAFT_568364 [Calocera viscosa TUFC12733]
MLNKTEDIAQRSMTKPRRRGLKKALESKSQSLLRYRVWKWREMMPTRLTQSLATTHDATPHSFTDARRCARAPSPAPQRRATICSAVASLDAQQVEQLPRQGSVEDEDERRGDMDRRPDNDAYVVSASVHIPLSATAQTSPARPWARSYVVIIPASVWLSPTNESIGFTWLRRAPSTESQQSLRLIHICSGANHHGLPIRRLLKSNARYIVRISTSHEKEGWNSRKIRSQESMVVKKRTGTSRYQSEVKRGGAPAPGCPTLSRSQLMNNVRN